MPRTSPSPSRSQAPAPTPAPTAARTAAAGPASGTAPGSALAFLALATLALAVIVLLTVLVHPARASASGARLEGTVWRTQTGSGLVQLERCEGQRLCGSIVRVLTPGQADARDANNPDPALRVRPVLGLRILSGLTASPDGVWRGGRIYNPEDGRSYRSEVRLGSDGRLEVKGCLGPVCQTQRWTPAR